MRQILAAGLVTMATAANLLACDTTLPDQVRIPDCRLGGAVEHAATRSVTLRGLLERVARTNGLIYVVSSPVTTTLKHLLGGMTHDVTRAGRYRLVRIFVSGQLDDGSMAIVGHELRHALEVLESSDASSEAEVDALYERIGWQTGSRGVETQAALDAGYAIERELRTKKTHARLSHDQLAAKTNVLR